MQEAEKDKLYLGPKDILEKVFKHSAAGYDPEEVDKYLDMIIKDYTTLFGVSKAQRREIDALLEENSNLKAEIRMLRDENNGLKIQEENKTVPSNIDLLRRISNLEKIVFGKEDER